MSNELFLIFCYCGTEQFTCAVLHQARCLVNTEQDDSMVLCHRTAITWWSALFHPCFKCKAVQEWSPSFSDSLNTYTCL